MKPETAIEFTNAVLDILYTLDRGWNVSTLDDIADVAHRLGLSEADENGMFTRVNEETVDGQSQGS